MTQTSNFRLLRRGLFSTGLLRTGFLSVAQGVFNWYLMSITTVRTTFYRSIYRKRCRPEGIYNTSEKVNIINIFHLTNIQLIFTNILQLLIDCNACCLSG